MSLVWRVTAWEVVRNLVLHKPHLPAIRSCVRYILNTGGALTQFCGRVGLGCGGPSFDMISTVLWHTGVQKQGPPCPRARRKDDTLPVCGDMAADITVSSRRFLHLQNLRIASNFCKGHIIDGQKSYCHTHCPIPLSSHPRTPSVKI
jgi:hypothetical protein